MTSSIPSRMLRDIAEEQENAEDLAEFVILLLDALEIPEVRDRVRTVLATAEVMQSAKPAPSGRTRRGR